MQTDIRAKKNHLHKKSDTTLSPITTPPQSSAETISYTKSTPYQDQETLEAEDLEIHQIMLEGYWVQPIKLEQTYFQHMHYEEINPPKGNNTPRNPQEKSLSLRDPKQIHEEDIKVESFKGDANPTYPTPPN